MLVKKGPFGRVANSSPYYGSNGGIVVDLSLPEERQLEIKQRVIDYYYEVEQEQEIALTCIITNPLYGDDDFYRRGFIHHLEDFRIGQLTPLPASEEAILSLIHSKTRNWSGRPKNTASTRTRRKRRRMSISSPIRISRTCWISAARQRKRIILSALFMIRNIHGRFGWLPPNVKGRGDALIQLWRCCRIRNAGDQGRVQERAAPAPHLSRR